MNTATGSVEVVKQTRGIWSLKLDDGNWYGFYKSNPNVSEGDSVSFQYVVKGNFNNADASSVEVGKPKSSGSTGTTVEPTARQMSIELQSARRDAITLLGYMLSVDAVKMPKKQSDKYDALSGLVEELTYNMYSMLESPNDFLQDRAMQEAMNAGAQGHDED